LRDTSESFDVAKKWISGYLADLNENTPSHDGEPDMDKISEKICNLCMSFTTDDLQTEQLDKTQQSSSPCPPSKSPSPMTLNTVDNPYLPTITRAYSLLMEAVDANEADGWQYWGEKQGVTKYRKDPKDSLAIFRGEKVLDFPPNILLHALQCRSLRLALGNGAMADLGVLERVEEHCTVQFEHYSVPVPFVAARDIIYIHTIHKLPDGTILSFGSSVDHPARPRTNQSVRADLKIGGWAFKPVPNEPGKTRVYYVGGLDLAGYVPGWMMNRIAAEIPMTVERLNKFLLSLGNLQQFDKPVKRTNVLRLTPTEYAAGAAVDIDEDSVATDGTDDEREEEEESEGTMDESWTGEHLPAYQLL